MTEDEKTEPTEETGAATDKAADSTARKPKQRQRPMRRHK